MGFLKKKLNVLILGSDGMLGSDLCEKFRKLSSQRGSGIGIVYGMDRKELVSNKITERYGLSSFFLSSVRFDVCVNCVAMTDTKAAEESEYGAFESYRLNALVSKYLAEACAFARVKLVHVSTDYVFSENSAKASSYVSEAEKATIKGEGFPDPSGAFKCDPWPVNAYGTHKLIGEQFVEAAYSAKGSSNWVILRTSWLYGMNGSKSFVHKLLKNAFKAAKDSSGSIEMTENEVSVPTSTSFLCKCVVKAVQDDLYGVLHAVPRDGIVSRSEWSERVLGVFFSGSDKSVFPYKVSVKGVHRLEMLQPEFSALKPSAEFAEFGTMDEDLQEFLEENRGGLAEWVSGTV